MRGSIYRFFQCIYTYILYGLSPKYARISVYKSIWCLFEFICILQVVGYSIAFNKRVSPCFFNVPFADVWSDERPSIFWKPLRHRVSSRYLPHPIPSHPTFLLEVLKRWIWAAPWNFSISPWEKSNNKTSGFESRLRNQVLKTFVWKRGNCVLISRTCSSRHLIRHPRLWALGILKRSTGAMSMLSPALMVFTLENERLEPKKCLQKRKETHWKKPSTLGFHVSFPGWKLGLFWWRRFMQPQHFKALACRRWRWKQCWQPAWVGLVAWPKVTLAFRWGMNGRRKRWWFDNGGS